jgi:hypothetical protein
MLSISLDQTIAGLVASTGLTVALNWSVTPGNRLAELSLKEI